MKTTPRRVFALMLALILLLSLCACVQKTQTEPNESRTSTDKVKMPTKPDKKTPEKQPEEAPLQNDEPMKLCNFRERSKAVALK